MSVLKAKLTPEVVDFKNMNRSDRIRACYQHCVLQWVMHKQMTNQGLRAHFNLPERSSGTISQIIAATVGEGLIKAPPASGKSRALMFLALENELSPCLATPFR